MTFRIEVKSIKRLDDQTFIHEWKPVHPSGTDRPYEFNTHADAHKAACSLYPDTYGIGHIGREVVRVVEAP